MEVNAHSLFSKWFSESGKLVNKLFGTILELVEDPDVILPGCARPARHVC